MFCTHKCYQKFSLLQKKIKQFTLYNSFSLTWVGGCLGSQPPRPFCPFHFHFLLPLTVLVFTFSFSAHSIKAKDLKLSSSNFTSTSIFNADSQSDVTGILGSLQCAIGVTGKGEPIYCDMVGLGCTDGISSTPCICTDRSSATGVLPDISAFDSHLCVQNSLYHPNIRSFTDPRSGSCPLPLADHTDVDISVTGHADKYIRAMSYRYAAQWVKNYTPKCWVGQDDSQCPENKPINEHKILLTDFGAGLSSSSDIKKNCCNYAVSSTNITTQGISPIFGGFSVTGNSSSTYVQNINTLGSSCGAKLHTEISCSGFNFCTDCNSSPNNVQYDDWATSSPHGQCLCKSSGSCGAPGSCYSCQRTGSPGSYTYKCVTPNTSCTGGQTWDAIDCDCDCPSGLVWNGSSCVTCPSCSACQTCVGGTCTPQGSGGGGCPLGEVCCGSSCHNDTCTGSDIWDPSSCSCKPPPCTINCGVCQTLDSVNCRCDTIPNCCTNNSQCPGSCNSCNVNTNTCTGGCSGLTPACCGNTCQASCSCSDAIPVRLPCPNCWETNNNWLGYPTCDWDICRGSKPTCILPEIWDPSTCRCEDPCTNCAQNEVCCGDTCKTRKTTSTCSAQSECQQPSSDGCSCENKPNDPPIPCSNCGTCSSGICTQSTPSCGSCQSWNSSTCQCESTCSSGQICCSDTCKTPKTDSICGTCKEASPDKCSCVSKPGPCGDCGTCSGGTCGNQGPKPCPPDHRWDSNSCSCIPILCSCGNWNAWTPNPNTVCSGQSFPQTRTRTCNLSSCEGSQEQPGTGTKCCCENWSAWEPSTSGKCGSVPQTRTRTCTPSSCSTTIQTQPATGSVTCNSCQTCQNNSCTPRTVTCGTWGPDPVTVCIGETFDQTRTCTPSGCDVTSQQATGTKLAQCWCTGQGCLNGDYTPQSSTCSTPGEVIEISVCSRLPCEPCGDKTLDFCSTKEKTETRTVPRPTCPPGTTDESIWNTSCTWTTVCPPIATCTPSDNCHECVGGVEEPKANGTSCTSVSCGTCQNGTCTAPSTTSCGFFGQTWNRTTCMCEGGSGLPASLSCHKTSLSGSQKVSELHASFTSCTCPSDYTAICLHTLPYTQLRIIFNALLSFGSGLGICEKVQSGNNDYQLCTDEDGSR